VADDAPMNVTIWSDVACPFCNVARERAAWLEQNADVVVEWLPFHLHPEYPPEGIDREELMRRLPAGAEGAAQRMNEEAGLTYNPHPERIPNTRRALELIEWARGQGAHDAMHERVMDAYWVEGRDITDWDELAALVTDVGLDAEEARAAVDSGAFAGVVDGSTATAQRHGITGVPAFVLDGRLLVSGAQPHEVFTRALEQVAVMREKDGAPTG
jgi:predicted DsbA family dithiol-disulfide isomerase